MNTKNPNQEPKETEIEGLVRERNFWEEEARRYCQNADFWKSKYGWAEKALLLSRQVSRWLRWNDTSEFSDRDSLEARTSDLVESVLSGETPNPETLEK